MTVDPVIRPATPEDPVVDVVRVAFADEGEKVAALWSDLARSELLLGSLVAEVEGQVVGHVGLSRSWVDARRALVDVWVLSPLSVVPARQGTGVGSALVAAAVETARSSGTCALFLEGDPGYYGPRGFARADRLGFERPTPRTPAPGFQVVCFDGREEWMTGRLIYADVFWRHDAAGLRDPLLAEIEERLR